MMARRPMRPNYRSFGGDADIRSGFETDLFDPQRSYAGSKSRSAAVSCSYWRVSASPGPSGSRQPLNRSYVRGIDAEFSCIEHALALGAREPQVRLDGSSLS
jgi:hypothetical protein